MQKNFQTYLLLGITLTLIVIVGIIILFTIINPNRVAVEITSTPSDATVTVQNIASADNKTPLKLTGVEKGSVLVVTANKPGYYGTSVTETVKEDNQRIHLDLTPAPVETKVSPAPSAKEVTIHDPIRIDLPDEIPMSEVTIDISPKVEGTRQIERTTNSVAFIPRSPLSPSTTYTVEVYSSQGTKRTIYRSWSFRTAEQMGESGFNAVEQQQFNKALKASEQAYTERKRRFPFLTKLPYTTPHYKIEISAVTDTITITTIGSPDRVQIYREDALAWLRNNGGNPQTLTIVYKHEQ